MNKKLIMSIFTALFAAIIAAGAFIAIPAGPSMVPIVLQNMLAVLAGCLLGGLNGGLATLLFLFAGALGLPVFSGGRGGLAHFLSPTGGFLIGYVIAAFTAGFIAGRPTLSKKEPKNYTIIRICIATIVGFVLLYIPGIAWFMYSRKATFGATMAACVIPFIPGACIKMILTAILSLKLRPLIARYIADADD